MNVATDINHNIDENLKKELLSKTATLISYLGNDYINKLNELNDQYDITNRRTVSNVKLAINET